MRRLDTWDSLSPLRRFGRLLLRRPSPSLSQKENPSVSPNPFPLIFPNPSQPSPVIYSVNVSATTTTYAHPMYGFASGGVTSSPPPPLLSTERRETPVIGYRGWYCCGPGQLAAVSAHRTWKPGINEAECVVGVGPASYHEAPVDRCTCGLHLVRDWSRVMSLSGLPPMWPVVLGACMAWGKLVQHGHQGYRVQYAQIVALLESDYGGVPYNKLLRATAEHYGVPLLQQDAFLSHAAEFGEPLP